MDPHCSAQDVLRCHLCEVPVPPYYCDRCDINLCKTCAGEHLLDETKEHRVLPIKQRSTPNYPKCSKHTRKLCELHCDECNIPICSRCVSSKKHQTHNLIDILTLLESKKKLLRKDLEELENNIYPIYQEIASEITDQKSEMNKNSERLRSCLDKRGKEWHNKIDAMINEMKLEIYRTHSEIETALNKQEEEIKHSITDMTKSIVELKRVLDSSDACLVSEYKSRNCEFKKLPRKLVFFFPTLLTNKTDLRETFGTLSAPSITTQERFHTIVSPDAHSNSPSSRQLLDEPVILTTIDTGIGYLYSVVCLDDDKILTTDKHLKIFNLHGELLQSIQPKSGKIPSDIAVTKDGDIVYTDRSDHTVNVVKDTQIQTVIKLQGWLPFNIFCTSSGDLLVIMVCEEYIQTKIVRYSGSTEKQSIQFNDEGQPLFSSSVNTLYICENRNFDICVAHLMVVQWWW